MRRNLLVRMLNTYVRNLACSSYLVCGEMLSIHYQTQALDTAERVIPAQIVRLDPHSASFRENENNQLTVADGERKDTRNIVIQTKRLTLPTGFSSGV